MIEAFLAASLLAHSPQQPATDAAAPPVPSQQLILKNPWVAAGLSVATPALFWTASVPVFGVAGPLGSGAGHWYAGDTTRASYVTMGGIGAFMAGGAWGYYRPTDDLRPRRLLDAGMNAALFSIVYGVWAAFDAYQTAERMNALQSPIESL